VTPSSLRPLLQAAYSVTPSTSAWLHGLAQAAHGAFGHGVGAMTALFDARDPTNVHALDVASTLEKSGFAQMVDETFRGVEPAFVDYALATLAFTALGSNAPPQQALSEYMAKVAVGDLLAIVASDPSGIGIVVNVLLPERTVLSSPEIATLSRFSMHMASAYRLRQESTELEAAAVFRADGRLVSANEEIQAANATSQLREMVLAAARLRDNQEPEQSLEVLTTRLEAQWSVVSHFAEGPEEYVVARRNAAPAFAKPGIELLTTREQQVVSYLMLGRNTKAVAYELGISPSTVRVLVSRALRKLDARSIEELAQRMAEPP